MADIKSQFDYLVEQTEKTGLKVAPVGGKILLDSTDDIEKKLKELGINHSRLPEHIEIYTDKFKSSSFFSTLKSYLSFSDIDFTSDFAIIGEKVFFDASRSVFVKEGKDLLIDQVYGNNLYYLKIKSLFIDGIENINNANQSVKPIVNYHDETEGTMIMISATKGTMKIGYSQQNPAFDEGHHLKNCYETLVHSLAAKGFPELFKSEIYDSLKDQIEEARMQILIEKLPIIIENAERNFEVYINNFSFDELKDSLREEKIKYYNLTKDVLSKIYTQITGLTIVATATAFASSKTSGMTIGFFVLTAYVIYASFVGWLVYTLYKEVKNITSDFENECADIAAKSTLTAELIKTELKLIKDRLRGVKNLISAYAFCLIALSILFCSFIIVQMIVPSENVGGLLIGILIHYTLPTFSL